MLGHLGVNVADLQATGAYYDRFLPVLGFEPFLADEHQLAYRPAGGKPGTFIFFYAAGHRGPYRRAAPGLQHLAFMVSTRSEVREVHRLVVEAGGEVVHAPRRFPEYPPPYYAT